VTNEQRAEVQTYYHTLIETTLKDPPDASVGVSAAEHTLLHGPEDLHMLAVNCLKKIVEDNEFFTLEVVTALGKYLNNTTSWV
jgi:hypothetical protein